MASNRVIGRAGKLPWHLPEDLKFFKETTLGHAILMGRKTFDSIGKPLPRRRNLVLSRTMQPQPGVEVVSSVEYLASLVPPDETVYIIGGAEVFAQFLPLCAGLHLTWVEEAHEGDSWMPPFEHLFGPPSITRTLPGMEMRYYERRS